MREQYYSFCENCKEDTVTLKSHMTFRGKDISIRKCGLCGCFKCDRHGSAIDDTQPPAAKD